MGDNAKNTLQEYAQKHRLKFPKYESSQNKSLKWQSKINFLGKEFLGKECDKKTCSQISAAEEMLKFLTLKETESKAVVKEKIAILIDLENQPNSISEITEKIDLDSSDITIFSFRSSNYNNNKLPYEPNEKIKDMMIISKMRDASDVVISIYSGIILTENKFEKMFIITHDHFSVTIKDFAKQFGYKIEVFEFSKAQDCINKLLN